MPTRGRMAKRRPTKVGARFGRRALGIDCPLATYDEISSLSDFFGVLDGIVTPKADAYWFRGHPAKKYELVPSALRYDTVQKRDCAVGVLQEFRRLTELRIKPGASPADRLQWCQIAQHHGLPTRLLDWTANVAVALYFACCKDPDDDGLVVLMNPIDLNRLSIGESRVLEPALDAAQIVRIVELDGRIDTSPQATPNIAIHPVYNTERLQLQRGAFTLHGSRKFDIDKAQAPSLVCIPILREHKQRLIDQLGGIGVDEMSIFPEPEHVCNHLRRKHQL